MTPPPWRNNISCSFQFTNSIKGGAIVRQRESKNTTKKISIEYNWSHDPLEGSQSPFSCHWAEEITMTSASTGDSGIAGCTSTVTGGPKTFQLNPNLQAVRGLMGGLSWRWRTRGNRKSGDSDASAGKYDSQHSLHDQFKYREKSI